MISYSRRKDDIEMPTREDIERAALERAQLVLTLVDQGRSTTEIANELDVKPGTVRTMIARSKQLVNSEQLTRTPTEEKIEAVIGPLDRYKHQCHAASLALIESGLVLGRVGRGVCPLLRGGGQHSWVVLNRRNAYDRRADVIDVTAWSYNPALPRVWVSRNRVNHLPHGGGSILQHPRPRHHGGATIILKQGVSPQAEAFLRTLHVSGGLDLRGWIELAHCPIEGWPSREIITAMCNTKAIAAFVPIDIKGMVTDLNPSKLYLGNRDALLPGETVVQRRRRRI